MSERRRQYFIGLVPPARIARAAVVFGTDSFGEDNGALGAEALNQQMVPRRKIDVVSGVAAAGRTHVARVE